MSRRSVASLAIAPPPLHQVATAAPPAELTAAEAQIWTRITSSKPPDYFDDGGLHLLTILVRHISSFEALTAQMADLDLSDEDQFVRFNKLAAARDRESKQVRSLSASLRLSPQSRYTPQRAGAIAAAQPSVPRGIDALIARRQERARDRLDG